MDLLQNIRSDRARLRRKQPRGRDSFHTVSCIVKEYGLGANFLESIGKAAEDKWRMRMEPPEVKTKKVLNLPPFSLVSKEEYTLAIKIVSQLDNPYLKFAHTPEEILLSAPLYGANPALGFEDLLRYDFETLLLCQHAREELENLEKRVKELQAFIERVDSSWVQDT